MFSINKYVLIGIIIAALFSISNYMSFKAGENAIKLIDNKISAKQIERNATAFSKADTANQVESVKIVYRDKIVKEYIHVKEKSDIDININDWWVQLMDQSASNSESAQVPNDTSESTSISRVTSVVTSNYADCNYDKNRLRIIQKFLLDNGFVVESNE